MKKYICAALAVVMMATMFVGCGRRNVSDHPGGMITEATEHRPATNPMPTMTEPATTHATQPSTTHATSEPTNETTHNTTGPVTDATGASHPTDNARSRGIMPDGRS